MGLADIWLRELVARPGEAGLSERRGFVAWCCRLFGLGEGSSCHLSCVVVHSISLGLCGVAACLDLDIPAVPGTPQVVKWSLLSHGAAMLGDSHCSSHHAFKGLQHLPVILEPLMLSCLAVVPCPMLQRGCGCSHAGSHIPSHHTLPVCQHTVPTLDIAIPCWRQQTVPSPGHRSEVSCLPLSLAQVVNTYTPGKKIWLEGIGATSAGGMNNLSDSYAAGFL